MAAVVSAADRGSYTSPGIGARKKAILDAGGNTRDMAIAMLETWVYLFGIRSYQPSLQVHTSNTMTTDYTYGMSKSWLSQLVVVLTSVLIGDGKTGDGTNFGVFKQNWYMLRNSASEFLGQTVAQVSNGAILK